MDLALTLRYRSPNKKGKYIHTKDFATNVPKAPYMRQKLEKLK